MKNEDEWGRDPSVISMREIFKSMERTQMKMIKSLDISPYDPRLRDWRDRARVMFERNWAEAVNRGIAMDGIAASALYARCLAKLFASGGIHVSQRVLPEDPRVEALLGEI